MSLTSRLERWWTRASAALRQNDGALRTVLMWSRWVFMPLAVAFIVYAAWSSRELLVGVIEGANLGWLIASFWIWSVLHFMVPLFDRAILRGLGDATAYATLRDIYFARLPTKYLPGGIWHNVTRLVDLNRAQVPKQHVTSLAILQIAVPASVALIIGGSLVFARQPSSGWGVFGGLAAIAASIVLVAIPVLLRRTVLRSRDGLTASGYLTGIGLTLAFWIIASIGFSLYVSAYAVLPTDATLVETAGSYLLAWGTGFISIFTPQGLGVFEATAASLLTSNEVDFRAMIAIVAGFRVVVMASDTGAWLVYQAAQKLVSGGAPPRSRAGGAEPDGRHGI